MYCNLVLTYLPLVIANYYIILSTLFTCKNIIVLKNGYIAEEASYDKVKLADSKSLFIGRFKFSNKNCNIRELEILIKEIKEL